MSEQKKVIILIAEFYYQFYLQVTHMLINTYKVLSPVLKNSCIEDIIPYLPRPATSTTCLTLISQVRLFLM